MFQCLYYMYCSTGAVSCDESGWYLNPDPDTGTGCYYISPSAWTYNTSVDICSDDAASLATLATPEEQQFIEQHLP